MNIAFLTPEYPHEKTKAAAGIGTSIKNLAVALVNEGVEVSVFVYGQKTAEVFMDQGIKVHIIKAGKYKVFGWYRYRKELQHYVNHCIISDKIDMVEAADWTGITAFMKLKAPLVIRFHGSDAYFCKLENRKQKLKNFFFESIAIKFATAFIAPTNFAGALSREIFKIRGKQIQTISYGLSLSEFSNQNSTQFSKGMILYIGTVIRKKGVLELPAILKYVLVDCPDAHLVIVGNDSYDLKTQMTSTWQLMTANLDEGLRDKIKFVGKVPYQEVREYIKNANVCVFPTFAETLGMVTIEAMAMQKAVVNSNIGWSQELIEDGISGFLVHPTNHVEFAERIVELLKDTELCHNMGKAARERVEKCFDIEKLTKQNIAFYGKIIKAYKK